MRLLPWSCFFFQGTSATNHELSAKPRDEVTTPRATPEGHVGTNYTEEKPVSYHAGMGCCSSSFLCVRTSNPLVTFLMFSVVLQIIVADLRHLRVSESQAPESSSGPQHPHFKLSYDSTRAQKPPLPINGETVSKQVLSKQPRYQPIRLDDIMSKAGTLTLVIQLRIRQKVTNEPGFRAFIGHLSTKKSKQESIRH